MLSVSRVTKRFGGRAVLNDISLEIGPGEIVGVVGASGSGKTTLANCILGLQIPESGIIKWQGNSLTGHAIRKAAHREIQPVFQDPRASLNPRWTVRQILCEPLGNWFAELRGGARESRLLELLEAVVLTSDHLDRNPHELSTGQCQRVCLARALASQPDLLILDEPLSALDVSVQSTLLALLRDLNKRKMIAFLFISHDIAVVSELCEAILVMKQGSVIERGPVDRVINAPTHPYTQSLLKDTLTLPVWTQQVDE